MPEDHGIYNVRSYMEGVVKWMQDENRTTFQHCVLPVYLRCKWFRRAIYKKLLIAVDKEPRDYTKVWKLCPRYELMRKSHKITPRRGITDELLIKTIEDGANTYSLLKKELRWSTATLSRY